MDHALVRWSVLIGGLVAASAVAWSALGFLHSPRGVPGPGVIDALAPWSAALVLIAIFAVCAVIAAIVGRLLNPVVGLFVLGSALGVLSMRLGTVRDASFDGGSFVPLAIEGLIWSGLVAVASIVIHRAARDDAPHGRPTPVGGGIGGSGGGSGGAAVVPSSGALTSVRAAFEPSALKVAAIGAVALIGIWLLVTSPLKGQAIGAAVVGGLLAGNVAKRSAPEASAVLLFASPILFAAIGQLILAFSIGDPATAFVRGSIPNLLAVMPLDLVSGSIVGVALGIGLAKPSN